jgi:hypothetical protein
MILEDLKDIIGSSFSTNEKPTQSVKFNEIEDARNLLQKGDASLFNDLVERMLEVDYDVRSSYQDIVRALQQCNIQIVNIYDSFDNVLYEEQFEFVKKLIEKINYDGTIGKDINALVGSMFDLRGYAVYSIVYTGDGKYIDTIKRIEPKKFSFTNLSETNKRYVNDVYLISNDKMRQYSLLDLNERANKMYGINAFMFHVCGTIETNKPIPLSSIGFALLPLSALTSSNLIEAQRILNMFGRPIAISKVKDEFVSQYLSMPNINEKSEETMRIAISRLGDLFGLTLPIGWDLKFEEPVGTASVDAYTQMINIFKEAKIELLTGSYLAKLGAKGGTNQQAEIGESYVNKSINYYGNQIESTINKQIIYPLIKKNFENKKVLVKLDVRTESYKNYNNEREFLNGLKIPISYAEYARRLGLKLSENIDGQTLILPEK